MSTTADYFVGVTIGDGAFGKVVHARHKATGKDVAIKIITKISVKKDPLLLQSVWNEKKLLSQLKSDYVVPLWASFHDSECIYLVMACSTGGDLMHLIACGLREQPEEWRQAIPFYALQLVDILEYIHSQRVIHADLKPDNILISSAGNRLKLGDFGSAIELDDLKENHLAVAVGTADYASPEVVRGASVLTVGVDLWSLGCIFYTLWYGQSPFHDESDALAIQRIVDWQGKLDDRSSNLLFSEKWKNLIEGLLQPEPANRLGMSDDAYMSIRDHVDCDATECSFDAPSPSWWTETKSCSQASLRDGAEGWSVFLL